MSDDHHGNHHGVSSATSSPDQYFTFDLDSKDMTTTSAPNPGYHQALSNHSAEAKVDLASSFSSDVFGPQMFSNASNPVSNGPNFDPNANPSYFNSQPQSQALSHASSYSSLNSVSSDLGSGNGLLVGVDDSPFASPYGHSRTSSFSFNNGQVALTDNSHFLQWTMPQSNVASHGEYTSGYDEKQYHHQQPYQAHQQPLFIETNKLGRASGDRLKGSFRSQPYSRQRSESVSVKSELEEDMPGVLSASTNASMVATPWNPHTTWNNPLVNGVNQMSLHHRRTSSNATNASYLTHQTSRRALLTRQTRSSTVCVVKPIKDDPFSAPVEVSGTAEQREAAVREDLMNCANVISTMTSASQQDKARGIWVRRWLRMSYTYDVDSTVPRQGLYHSYTLSCSEYGVKPINSASFGKAVRHAYPGIKTRRLGVRGNSKYHYVSLRPAIRVEAERLNAYGDSSGQWHVAPEDGSMGFRMNEGGAAVDQDMVEEEEDPEDESLDDDGFDAFDSNYYPTNSYSSFIPTHDRSTSVDLPKSLRPSGTFMRRHTTSFANGPNSLEIPPVPVVQTPVFNLPGFPRLAELPVVPGAIPADSFWQSFCQHQQALTVCVRELQWDEYKSNCFTFWAALSDTETTACHQTHISDIVADAMAKTFDHFLKLLLERLYDPFTSEQQMATRQFADDLQVTMENALSHFQPEFSASKIELAVRAGHLVVRFLELHQVTASLTPFLTDERQIQGMLLAWDKLDVRNLSDQCTLTATCDENRLQIILTGFRQWLSNVADQSQRLHGSDGLRSLSAWMKATLQNMGPLGDAGCAASIPRSYIARTSFMTSQILRDFTLKSEHAFGVYQLLKTWIDDYISFTVLRQTAISTQNIEMKRPSPVTMKVVIPSQGAGVPLDINTAVPFVPSLSGLTASMASNSQTHVQEVSYGGHPGGDGLSKTPRPDMNASRS